MKFDCPYCRKEIDFMELSHDSDLFAILRMLGTFGKHSNLVCAYTELFGLRPLKSKTKKWRLLLEEMKRLFDGESFSFQKRIYQISQAGIVEALNVVVHRNFTDGLDSHNYLKKIMIGISEKEGKESGRRAEKDLRGKEKNLMAGVRDEKSLTQDVNENQHYPIPEEQVEAPAMKSMPPGRLSPEQIEENKKRLKALIKDVG